MGSGKDHSCLGTRTRFKRGISASATYRRPTPPKAPRQSPVKSTQGKGVGWNRRAWKGKYGGMDDAKTVAGEGKVTSSINPAASDPLDINDQSDPQLWKVGPPTDLPLWEAAAITAINSPLSKSRTPEALVAHCPPWRATWDAFSTRHPCFFLCTTIPPVKSLSSARYSPWNHEISSLLLSSHPPSGPNRFPTQPYKKMCWAEYTPETASRTTKPAKNPRNVASDIPLDKLKISAEQGASLEEMYRLDATATPDRLPVDHLFKLDTGDQLLP
ncbi:hypothetical protein DFH09DRAFT_1108813 [Mycena vulgaris]|nr:hypothetical protein DFH09DRAFT_1108813 [Mycena vulgaris]